MQVGNFIGDFVKGNKLKNYPDTIRKGIMLHRLIDEYTDNHPVVRETIQLLRPNFGRYSGIVADMYFDYFLALHFRKYADGRSLNIFAYRFYISVLMNYRYLPSRVKGFIFHFVGTNRLAKYASKKGLKQSLEIMATHKVSALNPDQIIAFLDVYSAEIEQKFFVFFPDLIEFVENQKKRSL